MQGVSHPAQAIGKTWTSANSRSLGFATIRIHISSSLLHQVCTVWIRMESYAFPVFPNIFAILADRNDQNLILKSSASFVIPGRSSGSYQFGNAEQDCHNPTAAWTYVQTQTENLLGKVYYHLFCK